MWSPRLTRMLVCYCLHFLRIAFALSSSAPGILREDVGREIPDEVPLTCTMRAPPMRAGMRMDTVRCACVAKAARSKCNLINYASCMRIICRECKSLRPRCHPQRQANTSQTSEGKHQTSLALCPNAGSAHACRDEDNLSGVLAWWRPVAACVP